MSSIELIETDEGVKYLIDKNELLGKGTFGKVFVCRREGKPSKMAAKIILCQTLKDYDSQAKEIDMHRLASRENDYVVKLIDFVERRSKRQPEEKEIFEWKEIILIMEMCDCSLKELIDKKALGKLSEKEAQFYFIQIVEGLRGFNRNQIIHRDLKLENIMLKNRRIKFVDFGLSTDKKTFTSISGTPLNMHPKMLKKEEANYSNSIDIYAIGLILFELVTGFHVFDRDFDCERNVYRQLADCKEQNSGKNLFKDSKFFKGKGFKVESLSKDIRQLLEYMICTEQEQNQNQKVYDLTKEDWMQTAYEKFNKFYKPKICSNGERQRELMVSCFQSSIFQSRILQSKPGSFSKVTIQEKLEEYHIEMMTESRKIVTYLSLYVDSIGDLLGYINQITENTQIPFLKSRRQMSKLRNLLTKLKIFSIGDLMRINKQLLKEAFTSSGFEEYLKEVLGKKFFSKKKIADLFSKILMTKEEFKKQKQLIQNDIGEINIEFDDTINNKGNIHIGTDFFYKIVKKIEINDWDQLAQNQSKFSTEVLSDIMSLASEIDNHIIVLEDSSKKNADSQVKCLEKLNKKIYKAILRFLEFKQAKENQEYVGLEMVNKRLSMNSSENLRLEIFEMLNLGTQSRLKACLPFFYFLIVIVVFLAYLVKMIK